jgi:ribosomal protein L17
VQDVQEVVETMAVEEAPKPKKRKTARQRAYSKAFKKIAPRYKMKNGKWKKDGFKRCVKEAHRLAGGKK